jgi:hypothetical protein
MVLEVLERPDVKVFQEFGPEAPSLIRPLLEAAIVGEAFQIVEKGEAGEYFGGAETFQYPGKITGAVVQVAEVEVFLQQGTDEFDITAAAGVVIDATDVDLPATLIPEKDIVAQKQVAGTLAGALFVDEEADFVSDGVRPGDILNFILLAPSLIEPDSVISAQSGDFTVLNVNSPTELEITPVLIAETKVEYKVIRKGTSSGDVKITYRALRVDLGGQLTEVQDNNDREAQLGPADPLLNPLSYGVFIALLHTDAVVSATAISSDTLSDWTTAAEFLESKEIYAIVPLTHRADVHQMFQQHVNQMSEPENKKERIVIVNPEILDKIVYQPLSAAGSVTISSDVFTDLTAQFQQNGVPVGARLKFPTPVSIGGGPVSEVAIAAVLSETTVRMIAAADATVGSISYTVESPDFTLLQKALNIQGIGKAFQDRRVVMVVPDIAVVSSNGGEVDAPGYFLGAAEAGLISGTSPSQGFTNFPFAGILALKNSNFTFNETQLGVMAAGGGHIFIQETLGGAVTVRHQLTTDVTSVQRRELSIVKTIDFMAKFLRNRIRRLIGINNITDTFLNNILRPQTNGIIEDLVEDRIIGRQTKITRLIQDPVQKDTVLIDITVEVLFPANFINYTLII